MKKEAFIERAVAVHGDKFDYSLLPDEFKSKDKVPVVCDKHGVFLQKASNHLLGRGCNKCAIKERAKNLTLTHEQFLSRCEATHGDRYDYSKSKYINNGTKLTVVCKRHGDFSITPNDHLSGKGCTVCGRLTTAASVSDDLASFLDKALNLHGNKYCYSNVEYINSNTPVKIICELHGEFLQKPVHHLRGCECPVCAAGGYDRGKSGTFYIIHVNDTTIKLGITHNIKRRLKDLSAGTNFKLELIHSFNFEDGNIAWDIEKEVKASLKCGLVSKTEMLYGHTETTHIDNLPLILSIVERYKPD